MTHCSLHFDRWGSREDVNLVFPMDCLRELEASNQIASVADDDYSLMGAGWLPYQIESTARELTRLLRQDEVDAVCLVPVGPNCSYAADSRSSSCEHARVRRIGPSWFATFLFLLLSVLLPAMRMLQDLLGYFLGNPLELAGLVSGLLCVGLLAKQSFWTWPIGLFYSTVSVFVFFGDHLFASMLESVYYIGLNAYGWYFWLRGAGARGDDDSLLVIRMPTRYWIPVIAIALIGGAAVGALFNQYTEAALPFWDGGSMWLAFIAMWMAARKWLESWILWFIVDVAKTVIYTVQEIEPYAVLYSIYLIMAVWGWRIWRRSMGEERS